MGFCYGMYYVLGSKIDAACGDRLAWSLFLCNYYVSIESTIATFSVNELCITRGKYIYINGMLVSNSVREMYKNTLTCK